MVDVGADVPSSDVVAEASDAAMPACNLAKPFSAPTKLNNVDTVESEEAMWLAPDQLSAYLSAIRAPTDGGPTNGYDIFTTSRPAVGADFTPIVRLAAPAADTGAPIDGPGSQRGPIVSADGLTLIYQTQGTDYDISVATRTSTLAPFANPTLMSGVNAAGANDGAAYLSPDGKLLLLSSDRSKQGHSGIYQATRASTTTDFANVTFVDVQSDLTSYDDVSAVETADQLTIYFASTRPPSQGYDDWTASRSSPNDGFGTATRVSELSSSAPNEQVNWLSPDGCTIYMLRSQSADSGCCVYDVVTASKPAQ